MHLINAIRVSVPKENQRIC